MQVDTAGLKGWAQGREAVAHLAAALLEQERTKRMLIGAAVLLFIVGALIGVFAPSGRENLGYALSAVCIVLSLGAIGATRFRLKAPLVELEAVNTDETPAIARRGEDRDRTERIVKPSRRSTQTSLRRERHDSAS